MEPAPQLGLKVTREFLRELGRVKADNPTAAAAIVALLDRALKNPLEPALVRECSWVSDDHERFRYRTRAFVLDWRVKSTRPLSVRDSGSYVIAGQVRLI